MILNLLRVEQLRVEDMMKRSFSEFRSQKDQGKHKEALELLVKKMGNMPEVIDYSGDLEQYYRLCEEYAYLRHKLQVGDESLRFFLAKQRYQLVYVCISLLPAECLDEFHSENL